METMTRSTTVPQTKKKAKVKTKKLSLRQRQQELGNKELDQMSLMMAILLSPYISTRNKIMRISGIFVQNSIVNDFRKQIIKIAKKMEFVRKRYTKILQNERNVGIFGMTIVGALDKLIGSFVVRNTSRSLANAENLLETTRSRVQFKSTAAVKSKNIQLRRSSDSLVSLKNKIRLIQTKKTLKPQKVATAIQQPGLNLRGLASIQFQNGLLPDGRKISHVEQLMQSRGGNEKPNITLDNP